MDERKKLYQLFVVVVMLVLLTGGILAGMLLSKDEEVPEEIAEIEDVEEVDNKEVEIYDEEDNDDQDVEIVYVDIYKDCNHKAETRSNEYGVNKEEIKQRELDKIEKEKSGYVLVEDSDSILTFQKTYDSKCQNHYLLKYDNDKVVIFRYSQVDEYEKYQELDIQKESIRPDLSYRLEEGIEADSLEELYMFIEELES